MRPWTRNDFCRSGRYFADIHLSIVRCSRKRASEDPSRRRGRGANPDRPLQWRILRGPGPPTGRLRGEGAIRRANIEPKDVSELFFGSVIQAGLYQNCARQVVIFSGIPESVSGTTVNMVCGSGMKAMVDGVRAIEDDPDAIIVAGGTENMTRAPYLMPRARQGFNLGHAEVLDSMITDGLWDIYNDFHMAIGGEIIAERMGLTREVCDDYALRSQTFANKATESGRFAKEIVPVETRVDGKDVTVSRDGGIRPDTTREALARLQPAFKKDGVLTAGNSSQISDGASATVLMSERKAREIRRGTARYDQRLLLPGREA